MAETQQASSDNAAKTEVRTDIDTEDYENLPEVAQVPIIPKVRKCGIVQFKNRFNAAEKGIYAVDVLESNSFLEQEIQEELKLRQNLEKNQVDTRGKSAEPSSKLKARNTRVGKVESKRATRIRIQSAALLLILSKVVNETWDSRPRTFLRPFSLLISFHSQICEVLKELQLKWAYQPEPLDHIGPLGENDTKDQQNEKGKLPVDDSPAALAELRCYVQFMTQEIIPLYNQFEKLNETSDGKVRFQDLWFLFRVGEIVYRPYGTAADKETEAMDNLTVGNRHWRIYGTRMAWPKYTTGTIRTHRDYGGNDDGDEEMASFGVHCYHIDYTGDQFCVVTETFEIQPYERERSIKSLKIFPHRFLTNHEERLKDSIEFGKKFLGTLKTRHASYNWWTMTHSPRGDPMTDADGNILRPEYVDSEVIIDFNEAFLACPSWKPVPSILKPEDPSPSTTIDDFPIDWWSDSDRTKLLTETNEILVLRTGVTTWERNKCLMEDELLVNIRENDKNNTLTTDNYLRERDLILLPPRLFAYVLRERKFVQLDVLRLNEVKQSDDVFDYLKIPDNHKDIIQSLVEDHFLKKAENRKDGVERVSLDWVRGKGKGLFILLHGVPGVGKTATAEAVAQASGKPLFSISCGDLGMTPNEMETALQRIFRLANTWDCVLLLDEVDTFFSQRSKGDATLTKNVLVSVFLRVLEYYDGLLFLTTNRPGTLDEAFRSRIHLTLYYPPLKFKQTIDIWKLNIERLQKVEKERCLNLGHELLHINEQEILQYARDKFNQDRTRFRWNGRQIRNAFQIASSLAHFDARKEQVQPRLTIEHFKMIHYVTEDFDRFMQETRGKTDGELAFDRGDRADHWDPEDGRAEGLQSYDPPVSPGGLGLGPWSAFSRRSAVGNKSEYSTNPFQGLQPPSPRLSQLRPELSSTPSFTFNRGPPNLYRDSERSPRRESTEYTTEVAYNGENNEHSSQDATIPYERSGGKRNRGPEWSDSETQSWSKRRRESDPRPPFS